MLLVFYAAWRARRVFPVAHLVRRAATVAVVAIILEAAIGAGLVLLELVDMDRSVARAVSICLHLANTAVLMGALAVMALASREVALTSSPRLLPADPKQRRQTLALGAGFILLGMAGALTALGDTLFLPGSVAEGWARKWAEDSHFLERLRIFHPLAAVLWAALAIPWGLGLETRRGQIFAGLVAGNLALGVLNVLWLAPVPLQLLHLAMANLIWVAAVAAAGRYQAS